jgi:hypothetical protein
MNEDTTYHVNDYEALNKAITQESIKQEGLNRLTKTMNYAYIIGAITGILLIILLLICIYKLWVYDFSPQVIEKPIVVEKPIVITPEIEYEKLAEMLTNYAVQSLPNIELPTTNDEQNNERQDALNKEAELTLKVDKISTQEKLPEEERAFIETSFTIFHSTITASGESVVTGKEYDPKDITAPSNQYCYLRSVIDDSGFKSSIIDLANFKDGNVIYLTGDSYLNGLTDSYCVFK